MVKIHKQENDLKRKMNRAIQATVILWLIYFMLIYIFNSDLVVGVGFFLSSVWTIYLARRYKITRAGFKGEKQALNQMKSVPDGYHVFNNLKVEFEGKESETDLILVGKKGVFVIEVKNHKGVITGKQEDREWTQHKRGKNGGRYTSTFYNPTKQVGTHVWRLSKMLKECGIYTWVQGVVYFPNKECAVAVEIENIPVLSSEDNINTFLTNFQAKKELDEKTIENIAKILKNI